MELCDRVGRSGILCVWASRGKHRVQTVRVGVPSPSYIADMLKPVTTLDRPLTLRSADNNHLFVTRRLGERAFNTVVPRYGTVFSLT